MAYFRSAELDQFFTDGGHRLFPYGLVDRHVHNLVQAAISSRMGDGSVVFNADRHYAAWEEIWVVPTFEQGRLTSAVSYMLPPFLVDPKKVDLPSLGREPAMSTTSTQMARAMGISRLYCRKVRSGFSRACRHKLPSFSTKSLCTRLKRRLWLLMSYN